VRVGLQAKNIRKGKQMKTKKLDSTATMACIGAVALWSVGPIFIKYLTGYLDSWTQNLLRYSVACLFWLPFLIYSNLKGQFDRTIWYRAILPAGPNIVMQSMWAAAFYYMGPAFLVLLSKTSVLWVAGFSLILFRDERPLAKSRKFWMGLALSLTGVAGVLYYKEDFAGPGNLRGIVLALIMSLMWGVYTICVKIAFRNIRSRDGFSVISIYTVCGLVVFAIVFGDVSECLQMGVWQWLCVVISAVTAIALGHVVYYVAIRRIGATIPALVILVQPFTVLAISNVVFGESLSALQVLFGIALLTGAGFAIWAQQNLSQEQ
jgi:drug/metabolite transporter (DMT)-like permease